MKCPKCDYIGFDAAERCRNCGYDFALTENGGSVTDLPIRTGDEPIGPMVDLALQEAIAKSTPAELPVSDPDLPLFLDQAARGAFGDEQPPRPRAPLAVRRATPEVARVRTAVKRARRQPPSLELEGSAANGGASADVLSRRLAPGYRRILAAAIDAVVLGAVNAGVFLLTLRLCELTLAEWPILPLTPMIGFLMLLDGGYLVAFTAAGGQTIGKMVCRLKVVDANGEPVSPSTATVRAVAFLVSVLPLGLGFMLQFADRQRRALHDRLAETRVVKVS
jgi:uncharacterized RDD family membrane protein YckC